MREYLIKDVDGRALYRGASGTQKAFVEKLVAEGKSLARADLSNFNLTHLDLTGGDFTFACLDGADLRGTVVRKARLQGASMRGVRAAGLMAERANLSEADLSRDPGTGRSSSFEGSTFTYARFDGAKLNHADFSGSSMSSATMVGARAFKAKFERAVLHNVDWVDAEIVACIFRQAIMRPTWKRAINHMPDRTSGATVIGNDMEKAELGVDNQAFKYDSMIGGGTSKLIWASLTASVVIAGTYLPIDESILNGSGVGKGAGLIALTTAAILLKEKVEDLLKDSATEWMSDVSLKVRKGIKDALNAGKALGGLAAAFVTSKQADLIARAMHSPRDGIMARLKAVASGKVEILVCDRKHLAEALARITDVMADRVRKGSDLLVVRQGGSSDRLPRAVAIRRDGSVEVFWAEESSKATMRWNRDHSRASKPQEGHWQPFKGDRDQTLRSFMDAVLFDLDVAEMSFDPETHSIRKGKDGSVVVVRRSDGRLDNPYGPVILSTNDETIFLTGRRKKASEENSPPSPKP